MEDFTKLFVTSLALLTVQVNARKSGGSSKSGSSRSGYSRSGYYSSGYYRSGYYRSSGGYYDSSGGSGSWVAGVAVGCSIAVIILMCAAFILIRKCVLAKSKPAMKVKPRNVVNVVPKPENTAPAQISTVEATPNAYGQETYPPPPLPPTYSALYPPSQNPAYPPPSHPLPNAVPS